jgi:hypothetical protein
VAAACALFFLAAAQPAQPPAPTIHRHFTPADRETGRYQYVPFDVAAEVESLTPGMPSFRWSVLLGLSKVAPQGVDVDTAITNPIYVATR